MKTKLFFGLASLAAAFVCAPTAGAVPAPPNARALLHQPNGTPLTVRVFGDERYHGYESLRGFTIVRDARSGYWAYARKTADGRLVSSGRPATAPAPRSLRPHLRDGLRQAAALHARTRLPGSPFAPDAASPLAPQFPPTGTQRELVILAAYANTTQSTAASDWTSRFFGSTSSLKSYYQEVSYGQLSFTPAAETFGTYADGIVGWVKVSAYNGPVGFSGDTNQVVAAIRAADPYVNFGSYDTNRDGRLEPNELHITIIAAGDEQASCSTSSVWGHEWQLGNSAPVLDGAYVGYYAYTIFGELQCNKNSSGAVVSRHQATVGIIAHEMGHDLGMPDLYDIDHSSNGGVGYWSLMSSGTWNTAPGGLAGSSPAQLDAAMKAYMGWLTPQQVSGPTSGVSLAQSETNPRAVRLRNNPNGFDWSFGRTSGTGEYFLLENRQRVGYDVGLPGCGVLIWHVNEAVTSSNSANANESGPRLLDLEEGDGQADNPLNATDPWPSTAGEFNDNSFPNARLYSGALSGVKVTTTSTACSSTMTVNTADGTAPAGVPNDNFAAATSVGAVPYAQTGIATASATKEAGEQAPSCETTMGKTVWWRFTPATSMRVKAETTGSNFDTVLAAWTGSTIGALTEANCNDDSAGPAGPSAFELQLVGGQTYYFQAGGFGGTSGTLNFSLSRVSTAPVNDTFANAIGASDLLPFERTGIATADATTEAGEPQPSCAPAGKTIWFRYTPSDNVRVKAETTGSAFDTVLAAYRGTALGALTEAQCNDDASGPAGPSAFEVDLTGGQTYYFQAGGYNNAGNISSGSLSFKLSRVATAPVNDAFAGATVVSLLPFAAAGPNADATVEAGEPSPSCAPIGKTVWYRFVPSTTMTVVAETTNSSLNFDTVLAGYRGTSLGALTQIGCSDDIAAAGGPSSFQVTLTAGQTYYFQAGGFKGSDGSVAQGTLGFKLSAVATSDVFAGAVPIGALPFTQTGTTASATEEAGEPAPACAPIGKTVWYRFTPGASVTVNVSTQGSAFDTVLAVWRGTSIGALTQVGCDDDGVATGGASRILNLALTAGQTYYVQLGGYRSANTTDSGAYSFSLQSSTIARRIVRRGHPVFLGPARFSFGRL